MHILIITEVFYPIVGGAGKIVFANSKNLVKRGYKVSVITRMSQGLEEKENINGINVYRISWSSNFIIQLFSFFNISRFIGSFLLKNSVDLIITNQPFSAFSAYFSKSAKCMPKIYHFHSSWFEEFEVKKGIKDIGSTNFKNILRLIVFKPVSFIMRVIEQFVVTHYDEISVSSSYSKEKLIEFYNIDEDKINIIYGYVDGKLFSPSEDKSGLRESLGINQDKYVLVTARNLVERMGIENLILAFYNLSKSHKDLFLLIIGGGRLKKKLIDLAEKLGIGNAMRFTGQLQESDVAKYFQASDLFILPTKYIEHFGLATIEALAVGLPVLGTPVGGTIEILNKFNKEFIFQGTDAKSIEQGIEKFLERYKSVDLKNKCRDFAIGEYSLDKIIDQTEQMYLNIIRKWKIKNQQK